MIDVLVCEDSSTARALLVGILRACPELRVVGEARDGIEAVEMTLRLRPHVVTMDIHMPHMDGLAATKEIMASAPTPIVIVSGSTSVQDVGFAMSALRLGAVAVLRKPEGPLSGGFVQATQQVVRTVKGMAGLKLVRHWRPATRPTNHAAPSRKGRAQSRIVAIATSTGGPPALEAIVSKLPKEFPVPIVVVQHITHGFIAGLAAWLNTVCALHVKIAEHDMLLEPHSVYFAPDDHHLGVNAQGRVSLSKAPAIGGFRPSGTFLFESVAKAFGRHCISLILTGMGDDGVAGLRSVRAAGGTVIAQDEETSIVFGMPGAAVAAGLVDQVVPLDTIASRLQELV